MRGWSGLHGAADAEWEVSSESGWHSVTVPEDEGRGAGRLDLDV